MVIGLVVYFALAAAASIVVFPALIVGARADRHMVESSPGEPELLEAAPQRIEAAL